MWNTGGGGGGACPGDMKQTNSSMTIMAAEL